MSSQVTAPSASPEPLTPLQERALRALLTAPTHEAAAQLAGITANTLWRYLRQPEFRDAFRDARREAVSQSIAQLQRLTADAVHALGAVAASETATPTARVTAAKAILEMSLRAVDVEELSTRIEALEEMNQSLRT